MTQTEISLYYPEDSHVSQYQVQGIDLDAMIQDGCGMNFTGLSKSADRLGLLQKMYLDWLRSQNIHTSSMVWKRKATQSRHSYYQLQMWAHRTLENEHSLLPTPVASDWMRCQVSRADMSRKSPGVPVFAAMLEKGLFTLPTPTTSQIYKIIRQLTPSEMGGGHGIALVAMVGKIYPSLIGRRIHPKFVEWMMGFPDDWTNTDCKLSAMQLCQDKYSQSLKQSQESKKEKKTRSKHETE